MKAIRVGYAAYRRGDLEPLLALLTPDCVTDETHALPDGATYVGEEGFRQNYAEVAERWSSLTVTPETVFELPGHVIVQGTATMQGAQSGAAIGQEFAHVFEFRDGRIARITFYLSLDAALESLGADRAAILAARPFD